MTPTDATRGPESDDGRQDAPGATDAADEAREAVDLDAIEARAEAATPGHWAAAEGASGNRWWIEKTNTATIAWIDHQYAGPADADHIAGMDPATTLALVRELREARAEVERQREVIRGERADANLAHRRADAAEDERDDLRARLAKVEAHPVVVEIAGERARQFAKHGDQSNLPNGTAPSTIFLDLPHHQGHARADHMAAWAKARTDAASHSQGDGTVTFEHILTEEWAEAITEEDNDRLRAELVQVAAVAVQWIEAIDIRAALGGDS